jgi:pilus assembly protein CpaE
MAIRDVLLLTAAPDTVQAVQTALSSNGQLTDDNVFQDLRDLALRLDRGGVPAVLVDIDGQGAMLLPAVEGLVRKFGDTRFIALSTVMRNDLLLEAMQVGVRHFMLKGSIASELSSVLHRLCPDGQGGVRGAAVTILSAGGGCGATTVAVNLAAELQSAVSSPSLVVDLDATYGAVGTYLGLDGAHGVMDLMHRMGPIDAQLIQSTALVTPIHLHALLSQTRSRLGEPAAYPAERVGQLIEACRSAYKWSVVDAPRVAPDVAAELARVSTATLVLLQLSIKDIQIARQMLNRLKDQGIASDRVLVMATRYRKRAMLISPEEARKALGLEANQPLGLLSNDFTAVQEAVNFGKPLSQSSPRSDLRRELQKLTGQIAAMPLPVAGGAAPRSSLFAS